MKRIDTLIEVMEEIFCDQGLTKDGRKELIRCVAKLADWMGGLKAMDYLFVAVEQRLDDDGSWPEWQGEIDAAWDGIGGWIA